MNGLHLGFSSLQEISACERTTCLLDQASITEVSKMNEMPIVSVSVVARVLAHRRDEHPIGKLYFSNRERIKQASHGQRSVVSGRSSMVTCHSSLVTAPRDHRVVELRHEPAFVWSGIVSERFRLFDQDLFRVAAQHFHCFFD